MLNEVERNLHDAMGVARNVVRDPRLVPGGGACEMAVSRALRDRSAAIQGAQPSCTPDTRAPHPLDALSKDASITGPGIAGVEQWPYSAVGVALEVIPRTLAQNCGANVIRSGTATHCTAPQSSTSLWSTKFSDLWWQTATIRESSCSLQDAHQASCKARGNREQHVRNRWQLWADCGYEGARHLGAL